MMHRQIQDIGTISNSGYCEMNHQLGTTRYFTGMFLKLNGDRPEEDQIELDIPITNSIRYPDKAFINFTLPSIIANELKKDPDKYTAYIWVAKED